MPVVPMFSFSRPPPEVVELGELDMPPINMWQGRDIDRLLASLADLEENRYARICGTVEVLLEDTQVLQTSGRISVAHRNGPGYSIITPDQRILITSTGEIAPSWEHGGTYVYAEGKVITTSHLAGDQVRIYPPRPQNQRRLQLVRL